MVKFNISLDIKSLDIISQEIDKQGNIILTVQSKKSESQCPKCGKPATKRYGYAPVIDVRHLPVLDTPVYLRIKPVRYQCEHCDGHPVTTEHYDWCARRSTTTTALDEYLARSMINSTVTDVARKERIAYKTVVAAIRRQIKSEVDWSQYSDLHTLGIDEISDKKGRQDFLTIVGVRNKQGELSVIAVLGVKRQLEWPVGVN